MNHKFQVVLSEITIETWAKDSDTAVSQVLEFEKAPFSAFRAVYQDNPVPRVSTRYGAPFGRPSNRLDPDGIWKAKRVPVDGDGYDEGGSYWGLRIPGESIYAVQDGSGNIAFVDATGPEAALKVAQAIGE